MAVLVTAMTLHSSDADLSGASAAQAFHEPAIDASASGAKALSSGGERVTCYKIGKQLMPRSKQTATPPAKRMASYRQRMRAAGLRPVQIWVPDTRSPEFAEICRRQSLAVAAHDPAGDELIAFVESVYEWPED